MDATPEIPGSIVYITSASLDSTALLQLVQDTQALVFDLCKHRDDRAWILYPHHQAAQATSTYINNGARSRPSSEAWLAEILGSPSLLRQKDMLNSLGKLVQSPDVVQQGVRACEMFEARRVGATHHDDAFEVQPFNFTFWARGSWKVRVVPGPYQQIPDSCSTRLMYNLVAPGQALSLSQIERLVDNGVGCFSKEIAGNDATSFNLDIDFICHRSFIHFQESQERLRTVQLVKQAQRDRTCGVSPFSSDALPCPPILHGVKPDSGTRHVTFTERGRLSNKEAEYASTAAGRNDDYGAGSSASAATSFGQPTPSGSSRWNSSISHSKPTASSSTRYSPYYKTVSPSFRSDSNSTPLGGSARYHFNETGSSAFKSFRSRAERDEDGVRRFRN
ncbi:hypothetical protein JCM11641_006193 [Rhodosporidiobolus odoratus]